MRLLFLLPLLACDNGEEREQVESVPELSPCEQALSHLVEWADAEELSSQRQAAMVVACEDRRSMATSDRLDCLVQDSPEAAARCTIVQERRSLIEACVQDGGEDLRGSCELTLAEPAPVLLEARIRPLVDGRWLELWSCHAPEDGALAPESGPLLICGLQISRKIFLEDCTTTQVRTSDCEARWNLRSTRVEHWLSGQLAPDAG